VPVIDFKGRKARAATPGTDAGADDNTTNEEAALRKTEAAPETTKG
jgi:hypothetical protein